MSDEWHEIAPLYSLEDAIAEAKRRIELGFSTKVYKLVETYYFAAKVVE